MNDCKIIAIVNQKGGVGKTTTTINLSAGLARAGKRVLMIDMDPQASLTLHSGLIPDDMPYSISNALDTLIERKQNTLRDDDYAELIVTLPHLGIIPANIALTATEIKMITSLSPASFLKRIVDPLRCKYDYIIIDANPSLGMLTFNALTAADEVIIPTGAKYLDTRGVGLLFASGIDQVRYSTNADLKVKGILITMLDERLKSSRKILSELHEALCESGIRIFETMIPMGIKASEASEAGQDLFAFAPESKVGQAYDRLVKEVLISE